MIRIVVVCLVLAGCDGTAALDAKDGKGVFAAYCSSCHGPLGKPTAAMMAKLAVRDLTSMELRARVTSQLVEKQVRTGSDNKLMPSFTGVLSEAQIKAVASWVASPEFLLPP